MTLAESRARRRSVITHRIGRRWKNRENRKMVEGSKIVEESGESEDGGRWWKTVEELKIVGDLEDGRRCYLAVTFVLRAASAFFNASSTVPAVRISGRITG